MATAADLAEALALRSAVLGGSGTGAPWESHDEFDRDSTTLHCVVRSPDGVCVGAGRLTAPVDVEDGGELIEGNPTIGPIVVAPSARRGGVGRAILSYLEAEALALYGSNGVVRVDIWVPADGGEPVSRLGYEIPEGPSAAAGTPVFRASKDLAAS